MDVELTTLPWYFTTDNETNTTLFVRPAKLQRAYNIMLAATVAFIMFAMGCGTNWSVIKPQLKKPVAPIIGMVCQLILLPAICFGFAHAFKFPAKMSIGMIIMSSSPGGAVSNILSFWSNGDLPLSITMTTFSTTLALGFVPLNMFMYTQSWKDEVTRIPYLEMFVTVLYTWIAAILGFIVGTKAPRAGQYITRVGSAVGFALIIVCGLLQAKLFPEVYDLPWSVWFCGITIPLIGYGIGNALGAAAKLPMKKNRTIGFETGMQNAAVAMTMIALSYPDHDSVHYVPFPLLYSAFMIVDGVIIVIIHRIYFAAVERRCICQQKQDRRRMKLEQLEESDCDSKSSISTLSNVSMKSTKAPVNLAVGKFKVLSDTPPFNADGVLSTFTIGEGASTEQQASIDEKPPLDSNGHVYVPLEVPTLSNGEVEKPPVEKPPIGSNGHLYEPLDASKLSNGEVSMITEEKRTEDNDNVKSHTNEGFDDEIFTHI